MTPDQIKYAIEIGESLVECAKVGISGVMTNVTVGPLQTLLSCAHRTLASMESASDLAASEPERLPDANDRIPPSHLWGDFAKPSVSNLASVDSGED